MYGFSCSIKFLGRAEKPLDSDNKSHFQLMFHKAVRSKVSAGSNGPHGLN